MPGVDHGSGGVYGDHERYDFFAGNLLRVNPPDWKVLEELLKRRTTTTTAVAGEESNR